MNEILLNILSVVITAVVLPLISLGGTQLIKLVNSKIKNDTAAKFLIEATTVVTNSVRCVFQTYVESLKAEGKFDAQSQEIALKKARDITFSQLSENEHPFIGEATVEEFAEFPKVVEWYEAKCRSLFGAEKFNYLAAMMKDNFVHFHAFPRYSKDIEMLGEVWKDVDWPRPVSPAGVAPSEDTVKKLIDLFRN